MAIYGHIYGHKKGQAPCNIIFFLKQLPSSSNLYFSRGSPVPEKHPWKPQFPQRILGSPCSRKGSSSPPAHGVERVGIPSIRFSCIFPHEKAFPWNPTCILRICGPSPACCNMTFSSKAIGFNTMRLCSPLLFAIPHLLENHRKIIGES